MTLRVRLQRALLLGFLALAFAWSWACRALSPAVAHLPLALFLLSVVTMCMVLASMLNLAAGSVMAPLPFHTAINFRLSVVPVLTGPETCRPYALVVLSRC